MKITKDRLAQMIREVMVRISEKDEGGDEDETAEVATDETEDILKRLKDILEKWEEAEYESDEERWQDYAEDIQSLVNDYEGEDKEPKKKKDKDWGGKKGDDDRSAEERGDKKGSDYETTKKGDKTAKGTGAYSHQKAPSSPKSKGAKLAKMTYEAKKLEEAVYKKLKTMLKKRR
mgnify:CR=1 FL=1|jgi:hypothetical protein